MYEIKFYSNNKMYIGQIYLENRYFSSGLYNAKNITSIKSEVNNNRTQAIIWWNYKDYNQTRYSIYNISGIRQDYYSFFVPNTCINEENRTRINIFPTKNQFVFSCIMQNIFVQTLMFNKDNLIPTNDTLMLYASCENINGLSKLFFNDNQNYLIYSCFKNCSDKNYENDTYFINQKEKEEEKKEKEEIKKEKKEQKNTILILIVIITVIGIIFLIGLTVICMKCFKNNNYSFERNWKKGKKDEKLMKDIMTDLLPNN